jgi:hypothetical protein
MVIPLYVGAFTGRPIDFLLSPYSSDLAPPAALEADQYQRIMIAPGAAALVSPQPVHANSKSIVLFVLSLVFLSNIPVCVLGHICVQ